MNRALILLATLSLPLVSCSEKAEAVACTSSADCESGQACIEEECATVECLATTDCSLGQVCSSAYECVSGCATSEDCVAGEECNDGTCEPFGCRNTHTDCAYGELCDTTTGACYPDDAGYCSTCDPGSDPDCFGVYERGPCSSSLGCPTGQECYVTDYNDARTCFFDSDCSGDERCLTLSDDRGNPIGPYCTTVACFEGATYPSCDPNAAGNECARGFQCQDLGTGGVCFGDCEWLGENGHL